MKTDLSIYQNRWYHPGHPVKRALWYIISVIFFENAFFPLYGLKTFWLRVFGAKVGKGVLIKPKVTIKYPWFLQMGNHIWVGEKVWIDNLGKVSIGDHVCLSQGSYLLTGNHNYKLHTFDLVVSPISLEEGVWIGAKAIVCPGITCHSYSVLAVGSVATKNLAAYGIYQGNPAVKVKERKFEGTDEYSMPIQASFRTK